ncbi:Serum response factor like protein B [Cucumispora dikerogammari]|nr:Serum response factor like protein B [Cucumispora dikerogammari]
MDDGIRAERVENRSKKTTENNKHNPEDNRYTENINNSQTKSSARQSRERNSNINNEVSNKEPVGLMNNEPKGDNKSGPGRRKINIEYLKKRDRRSITFSKRKKGIMKKAYELSVLTGSEVLLILGNEVGQVYTFATPKLRPILHEESDFIRRCLYGASSEAQHPKDPRSGNPTSKLSYNEYIALVESRMVNETLYGENETSEDVV